MTDHARTHHITNFGACSRAIALVVIVSASSLIAAPPPPKVAPAVLAQAAADFANSVASGRYPAGIVDPPKITADEMTRLGELKGCRPKPAKASIHATLNFHWSCASETELTETELRFSDTTGKFLEMTINPADVDFAPTEAALKMAKLPSKSSTMSSFAKAASAGGDFTLGGLVPITAFQQKQLAVLKGRRPHLVTSYNEGKSVASWEDKGDFGGMTVELYFNKERQVIGLKVVKAVLTISVEPI